MTDSSTSSGIESAIALSGIRYAWDDVRSPDLVIESLNAGLGERWFIEGPSGSGKSTLLGLLSGVISPQVGEVTVLGKGLGEMGSAKRDRFRADHIGYIFQMFNLVPYLSVIENVTLPLRFSPRRKAKVSNPESEALRLLEHLGMAGLETRQVTKLSVGQQQRVAAARALIGSPELILADEPTSSLDEGHSEGFVNLLFEECRASKSTVVFVSHDSRLAGLFDQKFLLEGGRS
ncbi:ABC transporter ATP-binding protein [Haloferula sp.]|uniref:ABC transporter ATP-binding protein n=1 Tax=Haloferula sp. TaxID=2497595 RepID=UPI00329D8B5E